MSFDLFLSCFRNAEATTIPRQILDSAFGRFADRSDPGCWVLSFPDGDSAELFLDEDNEIDNFMVTDPPGSPEFWEGLYAILRQTPSVLYWPGEEEGDCAVVADASVIAELPADMIETIGTPAVITNPQEIIERINAG